jgi:hypothetical protein
VDGSYARLSADCDTSGEQDQVSPARGRLLKTSEKARSQFRLEHSLKMFERNITQLPF